MNKHIIPALVVLLLLSSGFVGVSNTADKFMVDNEEDKPIDSMDDIDWWPMFHHDLNHSGYSTSDAPDTNNVEWTYSAGGYGGSSPAVADGKVYVGSWDDKVYCLDAENGTKIWTYTLGGWAVDSSPAVAYGKVYVGSLDYKVYCLDAENGTKIWTYTTGDAVSSSPAVADGKVYIGSYDGKLYCFEDVGENQPPNAPTITGTTSGKVRVEYEYNFSLSDPDDDLMYLRVDWGNGTPGPWQGSYGSDTTVQLNHTWTKKGNFTIRAQAKDIYDVESEWATLEVNMPKSKQVSNMWFLRWLDRFPRLNQIVNLLMEKWI